jgi:nucleoside-diphosphate-sugar epimerase
MKVFITGALGFIGSTLTARYRHDGHDVGGVDAVAGPDRTDGIVPGDVGERGVWQDAAVSADLVIHTAAIVSNTAPLDDCWRVNVAGTRHAAEAASGTGTRRFVHLSSVRAFSDQDFPDGVDETWPVRPDGHRYVDTKVASEQVALQAHAAGEVDATVIRPGDVYGPGSIPWTLWPATGIPAGSFVLPEDGGVFSPVFVDNLVDGIVAASGPVGSGQVFTLSDGIGVPNEEFFGHYARMVGKDLPLLPQAEARAVLESVGVGAETVDYFLRTGTYSIAKARAVLGYEPKVDLAEGMRRTEAWLHAEGFLAVT